MGRRLRQRSTVKGGLGSDERASASEIRCCACATSRWATLRPDGATETFRSALVSARTICGAPPSPGTAPVRRASGSMGARGLLKLVAASVGRSIHSVAKLCVRTLRAVCSRPCRQIREIRHPQLVGTLGREAAFDQIRRPRARGVRPGRDNRLPTRTPRMPSSDMIPATRSWSTFSPYSRRNPALI